MSDSKNDKVEWKCPAGKYWSELSDKYSAIPSEKPSAKSWQFLVDIHNYFKNKADSVNHDGKKKFKFIFRGQSIHGDLKTSIERAFREFEIDSKDRPDREKQLIRSFQRKTPYHLNGIGVPAIDNTLEWLSLMQHYGAPTRLLDWTYSFYRALYNAVSKDTRKDKLWGKYDCELWVMNTSWFTDKTEGNEELGVKGILQESVEGMPEENPGRADLLDALNKAKEEIKDYKGLLTNNRDKLVQFLLEEPLPLIYNVTPIGLNERIIYQQGTFVLPGDITKCFMQNLEPYRTSRCEEHLYRIVIKLDQQERNKIIEELNDMNINEAVLFPGLDGFARSLRMKLAFLHKR
jgi:hypothetical protein